MADGGGFGPLGIRNWPYYDPPLKNNLGLQLTSSVIDRERLTSSVVDRERLTSSIMDRERKPFLPNCSSFPIEFVRNDWFNNRESNSSNAKFLHDFSPNSSSYSLNLPATHTPQMLHSHNISLKSDSIPMTADEPEDKEEITLKRRPQSRTQKSPKPKKPKKVATANDVTSPRQVVKRSEELVVNGHDLDLSQLPTPVCSCTGKPQQCYRWGVGGWQSACCTKNISIYPLPLSMKRRGARIAGRKMSLGAFKKVLEKLAGEGYNFMSNPIDLKTHWAKHGTNKFVTIR